MRRWLISGAGVTALLAAGCCTSFPPLEVVEGVDLERYVGKWYEIARYPVVFEEGCTGVTAEYELLANGRVSVLNTCYQGALDGPVETIEGAARVPDADTPAKLKVAFFPPFEADYWIIDLDKDNYQWAVVGAPNRLVLWVLSRTPTMDDALYDDILSRLPDRGYDPTRLLRTLQVAE